jgi:hypothetical protein
MKISSPLFYIFLIPALMFLFSCTSLFNKSSHWVTVRTNRTTKEIVVDNEKHPLENGQAYLQVERGKKPLIIGLKSGDSLQYVSIKSHSSFNYLLDAYCTWGIACFVERKNPKRYFHPRNIYLEQKEGVIKVFRFPPVKKGTVNLTLSIPYINDFYARTASGRSHDLGFLGIGGGLDFYYKDDHYLSLQAGAVIDNEVPFPVGVDHFGGPYEKTSNLFISLRNNHIIGAFDIGYGLSFSRFNWLETDTTFHLKKKTNTLGLSLATHYRITNNFKAGVLYQPGIFRLDNGLKTDYQHLLSVELLFTFKRRRG